MNDLLMIWGGAVIMNAVWLLAAIIARHDSLPGERAVMKRAARTGLLLTGLCWIAFFLLAVRIDVSWR